MVALSTTNINNNMSQWLPGNSKVLPSLLQLKPKAFRSMYNRSAQFIFQLPPNLLSGVEGQTLRGPVHQFQCSNGFLLSQLVPVIVSQS